MAIMKRIFLFLLLNFLVVTTLSLIVSALGLNQGYSTTSVQLPTLIGFCLVWGMGGALISLFLSKFMAKWMMGVQVIDPRSNDPNERWLLDTVYRFARSAGLTEMPEVGIWESPEINAFATGPTRSNSLVAVSSGIFNSMDRSALEGVIGHEVAHIANGDMVTMTLLQGVVNAFVMALSRIVAVVINNLVRSNSDRDEGLGPFAFFITRFVLEIVFMILGSIVIMWFSRQREFRADAGGARFAGREKMIQALQSLKSASERNFQIGDTAQPNSSSFASMKISATKPGLMALFRTHPSLDERIEALQRSAI